MIFDIVIPTFKRKDKLIVCLNSILESKKQVKDDIQIYLNFDNNDYDTYNAIKQYFNAEYIKYLVKNDSNNFIHCQVLDKQYKAFGVWNNHLKNLESDGMFYMCDDIKLFPECLSEIIYNFKTKFPDTDGLAGLNQSNIPKGGEGYSAFAMGLIGEKFAERFENNHCFCPDYKSFHADAEMGLYAVKLKKFISCNHAKIIHYHPAFFKDKVDEAHKAVRVSNVVQKDRDTWNKRQSLKLLWGESKELINKL